MEESMESRYVLQEGVITHGVNGTWGIRKEETGMAPDILPGKLV